MANYFSNILLGAPKKVFTFAPGIFALASGHLVVIYTPKEAHSRIFVTGGSIFARQMLAKKNVLRGASLSLW